MTGVGVRRIFIISRKGAKGRKGTRLQILVTDTSFATLWENVRFIREIF